MPSRSGCRPDRPTFPGSRQRSHRSAGRAGRRRCAGRPDRDKSRPRCRTTAGPSRRARIRPCGPHRPRQVPGGVVTAAAEEKATLRLDLQHRRRPAFVWQFGPKPPARPHDRLRHPAGHVFRAHAACSRGGRSAGQVGTGGLLVSELERDYRRGAFAVLNFTASRMSAFSARSSMVAPSTKSIARTVLLSRRVLKSRFGSFN